MIGRSLGLFVVLGLSASTPPSPHSRAPLQIAVENDADPWSRPDGTGFANEVVKAAFGAVDIPVTLIVVPYARCKNLVVEGSAVACFSMSPAPDLDSTVLFPAMPLFVCYTELLQNPAAPMPATTLRALPKGTRIGTVLGYEYPAPVEAARRAGIIVLEESRSEELLLRKLSAGRVQAALINVNESKPLAYLSARAHVERGIERVSRVGALGSFIGFSRRHPQGAWARTKFEQGFRLIASNGAVAAIERQWADTSRAAARRLRDAQPARTP